MTPDPEFLYLSRQHEEAIESLVYGVTHRKGFLALTGEIGTGKTLLCRELLNRLGDEVDTALLFNPLLSVSGLLKTINSDFDNETKSEEPEDQIKSLNAFLLKKVRRGGNAVVLIDEAQNLSNEALEMIRMLSNLETEDQKLLQILLVGQPELEKKLKSSELRQLNQRINVRYSLGTLNEDETQEYIAHRLVVAGGDGKVCFEDKALQRVYRYSQGYPRLINIVADRALLEAYAEGTSLVTKKVVIRAIDDVRGISHRRWWKRWF